jgi:ribosome biogenesis GTPase / thiamine phosphate phosphatase
VNPVGPGGLSVARPVPGIGDNEPVPDLATLGWDDAWSAAFEPYREEGLAPARVAVQHRGAYDVVAGDGELRAKIAPKLRRRSAVAELPVVGDWVALDTDGVIQAVLPRRTAFSRRAAHDPASGAAREQVIAANVDVVFVVVPLGQDLDRRLLERYVTLALESGAKPVIVLTKADLEPEAEAVVSELAGIGGAIPVHALATKAGIGVDRVRSHLTEGVTGALLGPSGAGKSTLVNALVGDAELLATADVRADGAGRHTTTRRQLVLLPGGGLVIDNPGMREVHLWLADDGLAEAFEDIVELASECRFADCSHETEPGCAIQAALADGRLASERWESYRALERELAELEERLTRRERSRARRGRPGTGAS